VYIYPTRGTVPGDATRRVLLIQHSGNTAVREGSTMRRLMSEESTLLRRVLVSVDVTSRTIDAKMLSAVQLGVRGLPARTAQYAAIMLQSYRQMMARKLQTCSIHHAEDSGYTPSRVERCKPIPGFLRQWKQQCAAFENTPRNTGACTRPHTIPNPWNYK
jgi:hypothetical protein